MTDNSMPMREKVLTSLSTLMILIGFLIMARALFVIESLPKDRIYGDLVDFRTIMSWLELLTGIVLIVFAFRFRRSNSSNSTEDKGETLLSSLNELKIGFYLVSSLFIIQAILHIALLVQVGGSN